MTTGRINQVAERSARAAQAHAAAFKRPGSILTELTHTHTNSQTCLNTASQGTIDHKAAPARRLRLSCLLQLGRSHMHHHTPNRFPARSLIDCHQEPAV